MGGASVLPVGHVADLQHDYGQTGFWEFQSSPQTGEACADNDDIGPMERVKAGRGLAVVAVSDHSDIDLYTIKVAF